MQHGRDTGPNIAQPEGGAEDAACYRPVSVASLRVDSAPVFDLYLRAGPDQPFVLYSESNARFTDRLLRRLLTNNIDRLYVREDQLAQYRGYLAQNLPALLADSRLSVDEKATVLYTSAQSVLEQTFHAAPSREAVDEGKDIVQHTVAFMTGGEFRLAHFLRTFATDYYLYSHSVNVAAYAIAFALHLGHTDHATLREVGHGALLHDIGMSQLKPELRDKAGPLSEWEWQQVHRHPREGHDLLVRSGGLGEIALDIVLHHHEQLNGRGYPDGLGGTEVSPFVRAVALVNIFDALTTGRPHRRALSTFDAINVMQHEMRHELDQMLLTRFVRMMGPGY